MILWTSLRRFAVARYGVHLLSPVLFASTALAQTPPAAVPESAQIEESFAKANAQVEEAFAELDKLSTTIDSELHEITQRLGLPEPPPPAEPTSTPPDPGTPVTPGVERGAPPLPPIGTGATGLEPCGTREEIDLRMGDVEERFEGFRQTINAANNDLPTHRDDVRDIDKVCTPQVDGSIASAVNRLDRLQINPTYDVAADLLACVDQRRRTIDGELNQPNITTIRIRLLTDELYRLTDTTHRVQDMEQALLRALSKRGRLVEELTQFRQEIASACAT